MLGKIVLGTLVMLATLWAMGYDAATIKGSLKRWSAENSGTISTSKSDWGPGTE